MHLMAGRAQEKERLWAALHLTLLVVCAGALSRGRDLRAGCTEHRPCLCLTGTAGCWESLAQEQSLSVLFLQA